MNKKIIENYMDEVWNKKNLAVIHDVFSDTAVIHSPLGKFHSSKEMYEIVNKWITAIPDLQVEFLHTLEDDGIVVSHWKGKGTYRKDFNGIKASDDPVEYQGVSIYRLENGKVVEYWAYLDSQSQ